MPALSDAESSGGDIPSRKELKKAEQKQLDKELNAAADDDDDDDEDMNDDEFVVEKILKHKFDKDGTLLLYVKWQGYAVGESTWEPETNLEGAPDEVGTYFEQMGGRPTLDATAKKDAKKRKLSQSATVETPSPAAAGNNRSRTAAKRSKTDPKTGVSTTDKGEFQPPAGSWEDEVNSIDTMERGADGKLWVFLLWKAGNRMRYSSEVVNRKCPQKTLAFYEAHLQFNNMEPESAQKSILDATTTATTATITTPLRPKALPTNGGVTKAEDEVTAAQGEEDGGSNIGEMDILGVKGVASLVS